MTWVKLDDVIALLRAEAGQSGAHGYWPGGDEAARFLEREGPGVLDALVEHVGLGSALAREPVDIQPVRQCMATWTQGSRRGHCELAAHDIGVPHAWSEPPPFAVVVKT